MSAPGPQRREHDVLAEPGRLQGTPSVWKTWARDAAIDTCQARNLQGVGTATTHVLVPPCTLTPGIQV